MNKIIKENLKNERTDFYLASAITFSELQLVNNVRATYEQFQVLHRNFGNNITTQSIGNFTKLSETFRNIQKLSKVSEMEN